MSLVNPCRRCAGQPHLYSVPSPNGRVFVAMCVQCDRVNLGDTPAAALRHWCAENPEAAQVAS